MPVNSMKASVLLNTPTLKRRAPLSLMMSDSSGGFQNKLTRNVEKIEEEDSNEETKKPDDKKEALKKLLIGPLPIIPENKATHVDKQLQAQSKLQSMVPKLGLSKMETGLAQSN